MPKGASVISLCLSFNVFILWVLEFFFFQNFLPRGTHAIFAFTTTWTTRAFLPKKPPPPNYAIFPIVIHINNRIRLGDRALLVSVIGHSCAFAGLLKLGRLA